MLTKLIKITAIAVVAAIAAFTITMDASAAKGAAQNPAPYLYTMKEYDGKIAIYKYNSKVPQQVLDVYVDSLPEADRDQLRSGLTVNSDEQLNRLIEDFDG